MFSEPVARTDLISSDKVGKKGNEKSKRLKRKNLNAKLQ